jgi:hypothetical protein
MPAANGDGSRVRDGLLMEDRGRPRPHHERAAGARSFYDPQRAKGAGKALPAPPDGGPLPYFTVTKRSGKLLSAGWTSEMFLRVAQISACWCSGMYA